MAGVRTTIRTFRSPQDAQNFYNTVNPYNRDQAYEAYVRSAPSTTYGGAAGSSVGGTAAPYGSPGAAGAGSLPGASPLPGTYSPEAGGVPTVPSPGQTQNDAITGNLGNLGDLYRLGGDVNQWSNEQARKAMEQNFPGYAGLRGQESGVANDWLSGRLSQGTMNTMARMAAERGVSGGMIGSPNSDAALLSALGKTSEELQGKGADLMSRMTAETPMGKAFDVQSFLTTPQDQQQWQWLANMMQSAPNPKAALDYVMKLAQAGQISGTVANLAASMLGRGGQTGSWGSNPISWLTGGWDSGGQTRGGGNNPYMPTTNPALDIVNKYMPGSVSAPPGQVGYPSYTGETPFEYRGTPTGSPTSEAPSDSIGSPFIPQYEPADVPNFIPQYWPEPGNVAQPARNYTPPLSTTMPDTGTDWWGGVDYSLGPITFNPSDVWDTLTKPAQWTWDALQGIGNLYGDAYDYFFD